MRDQLEIRSSLPVHPVPRDVIVSSPCGLRVEGLVKRSLAFDYEALARLSRATLDEPFRCEEGWSVPGLRWRGVRLTDILALAEPTSNARFVRVGSHNYVLPLSLAEAEHAILCDELNGEPLEVEDGAPWRLIVPGAVCYASVKWVDRLEVARDAGVNTAQAIARARLA